MPARRHVVEARPSDGLTSPTRDDWLTRTLDARRAAGVEHIEASRSYAN
jgi:hypothetical protein